MRPLEGKRIAVTRTREQAPDLCDRLRSAGARPVLCPTIRVGPPLTWDALDDALDSLASYGWIVFTSPNGVAAFLGRAAERGVALVQTSGSSPRVAAVGPRTARALLEHGVRPAFVPDEHRSLGLARTLSPIEGERILLARGDLADAALAEVLRERGAERADEVVAYRTEPVAPDVEGLAELKRGIDGITFTSPSTVHGLTRLYAWRGLVAGAGVATIGPVTSEAAREAGLVVHAEAKEPSMSGLVFALERAFSEHDGPFPSKAGRET